MKNKIESTLIFIAFMVIAGCSGNTDKTASTNAGDTTKAGSQKQAAKNIVFFGNSITAGYGLEPNEAFSALIQQRLDSLGLPYNTINAGVSGETSAGGDARVNWILRKPVNVFVLELGANDGLRGIPVAETTGNLQSIINKVKSAYPNAKIVLAGMQVPPNMGATYANNFKKMFEQLVNKNDLYFIPFILDGVGGEPLLNQDDGIHPNTEGEKIVMENVWAILKDIM